MAIGKGEIGAAVVLFTGKVAPGVPGGLRSWPGHRNNKSRGLTEGVGVNKSEHTGGGWRYQVAEFSLFPWVRVPRRDAPVIPLVQESIQLVRACARQSGMAHNSRFARRTAINANRVVV